MKLKLLLCLALVLSSGSSGRATGRSDGQFHGGFGPGPSLDRWVSFNGEYLLVRNRLWDVKTGREVRQFAVPPQISMSNGVQFGSAYVLWPPSTRTENGSSRANNLSFGAEMQAEGPIQPWDIATGRELVRFEPGDGFGNVVNDVEFSQDGRRILTAFGAGTNSVQIWDARTGRRRLALQGLWANGFVPAVYNVNFSANGWKLAILSFRRITIWFDENRKPELWDGATGERLKILEVYQER